MIAVIKNKIFKFIIVIYYEKKNLYNYSNNLQYTLITFVIQFSN